MGLDMYAARRIYLKAWDSRPDEDVPATLVRGKGEKVGALNVFSVDEQVMYWRKANHIHRWFVDNVQNGVDDCGAYDVPPDKLSELLDVCNRVIEASELIEGEVYFSTEYSKEHPEGIVRRAPGKVIKDTTVAEKLLPTQPGFFFGCMEYDEGYLQDIIETRDWLLQMREDERNGKHGHIVYAASW